MKIEMGKNYLTRSGLEVEVLAIRPNHHRPVIIIADNIVVELYEDGREYIEENGGGIDRSSDYDLMSEAVTYGPWKIGTYAATLSDGCERVPLTDGVFAYREPVEPKVEHYWGMIMPGCSVTPSPVPNPRPDAHNYVITLPLTNEGYPDFSKQPTWGKP